MILPSVLANMYVNANNRKLLDIPAPNYNSVDSYVPLYDDYANRSYMDKQANDYM